MEKTNQTTQAQELEISVDQVGNRTTRDCQLLNRPIQLGNRLQLLRFLPCNSEFSVVDVDVEVLVATPTRDDDDDPIETLCDAEVFFLKIGPREDGYLLLYRGDPQKPQGCLWRVITKAFPPLDRPEGSTEPPVLMNPPE